MGADDITDTGGIYLSRHDFQTTVRKLRARRSSELTLFSICAQIRYRPHQILYDTVSRLRDELSDLKQSQPNNQVLLSARSESLERGLGLLDEVINFSYCSQDEDLPSLELAPPPPCSFCGGELFRTVFRCTASCTRDDVTDGSLDSKILICSLCFVDGRACHCGSMSPHRLVPLAGLIELRRDVATLLGSTGEGESSLQ